MPPLSIHIPPLFRPHSRNNSQTNLTTRSRSNSIDSIPDERFGDGNSLPYIQRWNGHTREATTWTSLRRDPELFFPSGNCLIYLYTQGASRRGPSFRMPYDFLLYSACRPLIEQALLTSLQSPVYHPGSNTPPSYENLHDPSATDHTYLSLYLDAPTTMSQDEAFMYHLTTRNFFAWLVGAPLVGKDPVSALIDLKVRMDTWRDVGADNYTALQQYVQEQGYDDYDEVETRIAREHTFGADVDESPKPYRNLGDIDVKAGAPFEKDSAGETKRGRRPSLSTSIRSTSSRLRRKFSRSRKRRDDADPDSGVPPVPPTPTSVVGPAATATMPKKITSRPPSASKMALSKPSRPTTSSSIKPMAGAGPETDEAAAKKRLTKRSSFASSVKRRMSWVQGPLRPSDDAEPLPTPPPGASKGSTGPPPGPPGMGAPPPPPNPLPYRLTLQTQQLPKSEGYQPPQSAPALSTTSLGTQRNYSRPDLGRSIRGSTVNSQTSIGNHGIYLDQQGRERCECCSKLVRKPSNPVLNASSAAGPSNTSSSNLSMQLPRPPPITHSRRSSGSSLISAGAYALAPSTAVSQAPIAQPVSPISRSRASSTGHRSMHSATTMPPNVSPLRQHDVQAEARRILNERKPRAPSSREIVIPNYGNGLGSPTTAMDSNTVGSSVKGKERESISSLQRDRYTTSAATYGLVTTPASSSGFSGLPELDFSRSTPSIKSAETGSFTSAQPLASNPPSYYAPLPTSDGHGSAAASLHGKRDSSSFYSLVTSPQKQPESRRASNVGQQESRPSVDGLIRELEIAGIAAPSYGEAGDMPATKIPVMQDDDERLGVGNLRTLGLKA